MQRTTTPVSRILVQAMMLACVLFLVGGCKTTQSNLPGATAATSDRYATRYLGADGTVVTRPSTLAAARLAEEQSWWEGDGVSGSPSIVINLTSQKASFYKGGKLVGVSPVSTGREGYLTPAGSFRVIQKNRHHRSNLYGDYVDDAGNVMVANVGVRRDAKPAGAKFLGAEMPYFMRIHGGVGLHAGFLPGFADSHGCIRMPDRMAAKYFAHAPTGTPVRVVY